MKHSHMRHGNSLWAMLMVPFTGVIVIPGVDSAFFSIIVLVKHRSPFSLGFWRLSEKKDPWKEWKWKVPLEEWLESLLSAGCPIPVNPCRFHGTHGSVVFELKLLLGLVLNQKSRTKMHNAGVLITMLSGVFGDGQRPQRCYTFLHLFFRPRKKCLNMSPVVKSIPTSKPTSREVTQYSFQQDGPKKPKETDGWIHFSKMDRILEGSKSQPSAKNPPAWGPSGFGLSCGVSGHFESACAFSESSLCRRNQLQEILQHTSQIPSKTVVGFLDYDGTS